MNHIIWGDEGVRVWKMSMQLYPIYVKFNTTPSILHTRSDWENDENLPELGGSTINNYG